MWTLRRTRISGVFVTVLQAVHHKKQYSYLWHLFISMTYSPTIVDFKQPI